MAPLELLVPLLDAAATLDHEDVVAPLLEAAPEEDDEDGVPLEPLVADPEAVELTLPLDEPGPAVDTWLDPEPLDMGTPDDPVVEAVAPDERLGPDEPTVDVEAAGEPLHPSPVTPNASMSSPARLRLPIAWVLPILLRPGH